MNFLLITLQLPIEHDRYSPPLSRAEALSFVVEQRPKLLALAWSVLGSWQSAGSVFRELQAALDERHEQFADLSSLESWCWKAVRNRSHNLMLRRKPDALRLSKELAISVDDELRARDSSALANHAEALRLSLDALSKRAKWIVKLTYLEGKQGLEAARMLNLSPVAYYRELQRTYEALNRCLRRRVAMGSTAIQSAGNGAFERLVFRYLDDEISTEGLVQLSNELRQNKTRGRQFNDIRLYSAILRDSDTRLTTGEPTLSVTPAYPKSRRRTWSWAISFSVATAFAAAVIGIFSKIQIDPDNAGPALFLRGTDDVEFSGTNTSEIGDYLKPARYNLAHGHMRLRFSRGAEVNLEGPAVFTIESDQKLTLHGGTILATVPRPAIGFTVETDLASIRDLGTEFGVSTRPGKATDVVVFQGEVEVSGNNGAPSRTVTFGDGLRIQGDGEFSSLVASNEAFRFPRTIPLSQPKTDQDNLIQNPSFENGSLSLAPHSGDLYRDVPSSWRPGRIDAKKFNPPSDETKVGTVVQPPTTSPESSLPDGQRCLYLDGSAVRQEVKGLKPGERYRFSASVKSPSDSSPKGRFTVGLMTKEGIWIEGMSIDSEKTSIRPTGRFEEIRFEFVVPDDQDTVQETFLVLSTRNGVKYFDDLRLTSAPSGK